MIPHETGYFIMGDSGATTKLRASVGTAEVALGTASMGATQIPLLLGTALASGIRHFDMAEMYGNQKLIGQFFQGVFGGRGADAAVFPQVKRSEIFLTSKIWCTNLAPTHVRASLEKTLEDLQVDYLDQWLIHWPVALAHTGVEGPAQGAWMPVDRASGRTAFAKGYSLCDTWAEMERAHADGLVHNLGVSNFPASICIRSLAAPSCAPLHEPGGGASILCAG